MLTDNLKTGIIVIILYLFCTPTSAQTDTTQPWVKYFEQLIDIEDMDDENVQNMYESLLSLSENKINLNKATREDLEQIVFLTPQQIEEISEYIYKYGPVHTWGELGSVDF